MKYSALGRADKIIAMMGSEKLFFFDFDGTVSEITESPSDAVPVLGVTAKLGRLASFPKSKVAVISGRKYSDIKSYFQDSKIIVCGEHGAEIKGPGISRAAELPPKIKKAMLSALSVVNANFGLVQGLSIEQKKYAIAIHYRKMKVKDAGHLEEWMEMFADNRKDGIRIRKGKKVFEIIPDNGFGKSDAMLEISSKLGIEGRFLFAGDDTTDLEAFEKLGFKAIKIFVGDKKPESAEYILKNPKETADFIDELCVSMEGLNG